MSKKPTKTLGSKELFQADYRSFSLENPSKTKGFGMSPHFLPHFLMKKKYSIGIYKGGFKGKWSDLSSSEKGKALKKQWYVRWSYRNPCSGKMERQNNIYGIVNSFGTYRERNEVLKTLANNLERLLKNGLNPYDIEATQDQKTLSAVKAIDKAMIIRKNQMKPSSFTRYKSDINKFKEYLVKNNYERRFISSVTRKTVTTYLNEVLKTVSPRSRNNYKTNLSSLWEIMKENEMVEENFIASIPMLKTVPKQNKPFNQSEFNKIVEHLENNDKRMLVVFLFVTYNLLRPIEVCRLKVGDFDLNNNTFRVLVKSGKIATRIIPKIMMDKLPKFGIDKDLHLIGQTKLLQSWNIKPESKRGKITNRFREILNELGFGADYGLYSGRHYSITKIYRSLRKKYAPFQAKSILMSITGHSSIKTLDYYLRNIGAELPDDYSDLL